MKPPRKQSYGERVTYRSRRDCLRADRLKTSRRKGIVVSAPIRNKAQPNWFRLG